MRFQVALRIGVIFLAASATPAYAFDLLVMKVAQSLNYYSDTSEGRHFSITQQWKALSGEVVLCVRSDLPNGSGGWVPTSDFSMLFLRNGVLTNMSKEATELECPIQTYYSLDPVERAPTPSDEVNKQPKK
jgi:hypothetical protein